MTQTFMARRLRSPLPRRATPLPNGSVPGHRCRDDTPPSASQPYNFASARQKPLAASQGCCSACAAVGR